MNKYQLFVLIPTALLVAFVFGARFLNARSNARFARLHIGMQKDSVVLIMGSPERIIPGFIDSKLEMYDYGGPLAASDNYNVYFDAGNRVKILVHP